MAALLLIAIFPLGFIGGAVGMALGGRVAAARSDWLGLIAVPLLTVTGIAALPVTVFFCVAALRSINQLFAP